jgi:Fic family protein
VDTTKIPIDIGWLHYQFEATHPFLDGNGSIGHSLIMLLLIEWDLLSQPWLYLSVCFEAHRTRVL